MRSSPIVNIAIKDIQINMKTKRFIGILLIFVGFAVLAIHDVSTGSYAFDDPRLMRLAWKLRNMVSPFTRIFLPFHQVLVKVVPFLGILLGADLINQEIQKGSIGVTLSHPLYRDQFYIGKFLGALATVFIGLLIFYITGIGLALIKGIPVTLFDLKVLSVLFPITFLYTLIYLSTGIFISILIKNPKNAVTLGLILVMLVEIVYSLFAFKVASSIAFKELQEELGPYGLTLERTGGLTSLEERIKISGTLNEKIDMYDIITRYRENSNYIYRKLTLFVPGEWYKRIISKIAVRRVCVGNCSIIPESSGMRINANRDIVLSDYTMGWEGSLWEALSFVWQYLILMLSSFLCMFIVGYVKFINADLR
ncbi:ABC transporter permease [Thermococcus litoralis]|jgi:ABC-2 type transport system permease protein|nr:ABC transporter permease subunit [Thermococcus litoralis]